MDWPTGCTLRSHESSKHEILRLLENSLYTILEKMRVNAKVFFVIFACFKRQASVGKIA